MCLNLKMGYDATLYYIHGLKLNIHDMNRVRKFKTAFPNMTISQIGGEYYLIINSVELDEDYGSYSGSDYGRVLDDFQINITYDPDNVHSDKKKVENYTKLEQDKSIRTTVIEKLKELYLLEETPLHYKHYIVGEVN